MEAMDGYRRAALALSELSLQEQDWFLDRLDGEDRYRVTALLREIREPHIGMTSGAAASAAPTEPAPGAEQGYPAIIERARAGALEAVLPEQPDWIIALLLAECTRSAALNQFVQQLPVSRSDRIRTLAKTLRESVKPNVREVVMRCVAGDVQRYQREHAETARFDLLLERATSSRERSDP